jgi:hypothetical protein
VYIEFLLTPGLKHANVEAIKKEIAIWIKQYGVPDSDYSQKTIKNTHRLGFNKEKHFSLFCMTWNKFDYQVVNIANEKY